MKVYPLLLLLVFVQGSSLKDFLEGFLSGFHDSEVTLGEECLDKAWLDDCEKSFSKFFKAVHTRDFYTLLIEGQHLYKTIKEELDDCHSSDVLAVFTQVSQTSVESMAAAALSNIVEIVGISEKLIDEEDPRTLGVYLGQILHLLLTPSSSGPSEFPAEAIKAFATGFFDSLAGEDKNAECESYLPTLTDRIEEMAVCVNGLFTGECTYSTLTGYGLSFSLVYYRADTVCNINMTPKVIALANEKGLFQAFLRYSMRKEEILGYETQVVQAFMQGNYTDAGYQSAKIFSIVIGLN